MKTLTRDESNINFFLDANTAPRERVKQGEEICFETIRADNMYLSRENPVFRDHAHVMSVRANPLTGPVYIEGAEPGDLLRVHIDEIALGGDGSEGYYTYVPGQGVFANEFMPFDYPPETRWCDVSGDTLDLEIGRRRLTLPKEPFIGTLSVAPKNERRLAYLYGKDVLGNVDCKRIRAGNAVTMPVNVPGALLYVGDLHAAQGDGELLGCALECGGRVTLRAEVIKRDAAAWYDWPTVDGPDFIGSLGFADNDLETAVKYAFHDLIKRVESMYGVTYMEAYMLSGQCARLEICQQTGSFRTVLAVLDNMIAK